MVFFLGMKPDPTDPTRVETPDGFKANEKECVKTGLPFIYSFAQLTKKHAKTESSNGRLWATASMAFTVNTKPEISNGPPGNSMVSSFCPIGGIARHRMGKEIATGWPAFFPNPHPRLLFVFRWFLVYFRGVFGPTSRYAQNQTRGAPF